MFSFDLVWQWILSVDYCKPWYHLRLICTVYKPITKSDGWRSLLQLLTAENSCIFCKNKSNLSFSIRNLVIYHRQIKGLYTTRYIVYQKRFQFCTCYIYFNVSSKLSYFVIFLPNMPSKIDFFDLCYSKFIEHLIWNS